MKTVIAGPRRDHITNVDYTISSHYRLVENTILSQGLEITEVVCGLAIGFDTIGKAWAETYNIPVKEFPANWKKYGKGAGHIRNKEMAEYCDFALIFSNGVSAGTANMIKQMKSVNKPFIVVPISSPDLISILTS